MENVPEGDRAFLGPHKGQDHQIPGRVSVSGTSWVSYDSMQIPPCPPESAHSQKTPPPSAASLPTRLSPVLLTDGL